MQTKEPADVDADADDGVKRQPRPRQPPRVPGQHLLQNFFTAQLRDPRRNQPDPDQQQEVAPHGQRVAQQTRCTIRL
ncbi:hypothetical protein L248_1350 [Schleiferilactobacillus shenzhenensis LY-73]|uniref:Uncharacterized protein n=1 Tax=Schleiferilactobacillus shenzhenensis LY-73 TaxID=1231336 RepID=U4TWP8_9LACO|nr:hypothetical protein L248_1350 [Schleiferilactobacillus shenzhenensis LY-73]